MSRHDNWLDRRLVYMAFTSYGWRTVPKKERLKMCWDMNIILQNSGE